VTSHDPQAHSQPPLVQTEGEPTAGAGPEPPSREQLERVRARDPEALGAFFDRYFDFVFGFVLRLLGDRSAAEDVTQDVFYKIHRAADQLDAGRDPRAWVIAIARNACRDRWRSGAYRMARRSASIEDDPVTAGRLTSGTNDPERDVLVAERERLVRDAVARLPDPLREAVLLHDWAGLSHQDIAAMTGVEHAAARKRYSRALAALGRLLKDAFV
jgi:RNA polymerase sigma-70 factor (ECF subfamily)